MSKEIINIFTRGTDPEFNEIKNLQSDAINVINVDEQPIPNEFQAIAESSKKGKTFAFQGKKSCQLFRANGHLAVKCGGKVEGLA